jgi:hypothetical protein
MAIFNSYLNLPEGINGSFHDRLPTSYRVAITGVSCMAAAARCAAAAAAFWTRALLAPACAAASAAAQPAASAAKVAASCGERREGKVYRIHLGFTIRNGKKIGIYYVLL